MEKFKKLIVLFLLAVALPVSAETTKPTNILLQEALYAEQVDGNLDNAISIYEQIIKDGSAQRSHIAQALYRQGMCYLKKQDEQQARLVFEKLAANFDGQTDLINKVQPILADLINPDPALLMPPDTLAYIELGSPGRQIDTILNMLQGTPLANPLIAFGGDQPHGRSKANLVAALLNPSMMTELKKVRGMAVGINGIAHNNPPLVAVLYPGKSDALKGLIVAALSNVAKPGEPIEDMETLIIEGNAGAAYDDKVIILAQPLEQLKWCVKQYKGISTEPTLASSNKSFLKINKKTRLKNAITVWASVGDIFSGISKLFPSLPPQVRITNAIANFESIDDLITCLSINENAITLESNLAFKDGYNCFAYDLIRTPNLTKAGFEAVPPETAALLSIALNDVKNVQVEFISEKIENLTGLDIGREIFANIEQLTLFALPAGSTSNQNIGLPPITDCVGLAITSHNPQQTRQLLMKSLGLVNLITSQSETDQQAQGISKYQVGFVNDRRCYCYLSQMNKTTILSLNSDIVEKSVLTLKNHNSVCTAGLFKEAINNLPPTTSKLILINAGGAINHANSHIKATFDNPQNPAHEMLTQLAQACDKTYIRYNTNEEINNFSEYYSINQLPKLENIFPLLMQLSQTDIIAKAKATKPAPGNGATSSLKSISQLKWKQGVKAKSHKIFFGTSADSLKLLAEAQSPDYSELPRLKEGTRYYWRVDEIWEDGTVITGDIWNFYIGKLVGWWKLDESQGNIAGDSSGNNHNGTLTGDPLWKPSAGRIGGALKLDGDGDYVNLGTGTDFDITGQITVMAWIKTDELDKSWQAVVAKGDSAWRLQRDAESDHLEFACTGVNVPGSSWSNVLGTVNIDDGQWHHAAGVYDGIKIYLYVDGRLDKSEKASGKININDHPVYIGENAEQTGRCWNGLIDDIRVYDYALNEKDIEMLCRAKAINPQPSDGAIINPTTIHELSWVPATATTVNKVYLGTKPDKLKLLTETTEPRFTELTDLQKDKTYYWRVDGILSNGSAAKGNVWTFSAGKPIGFWKLNECDGSKAKDSSGNGNHGKLKDDVAWRCDEGKSDGAAKFADNLSACIEIPTKGMSASMGTIALWAKLSPQQESPEHRYIFGHTTKPHYSNRIQLYMDGSTTMLDLGLGDSHNTNTDMAKLDVDTWYQIALTWDKGTYVVYLNGQQLSTGNYSGLEAINSTANIGNNGRTDSRDQSFNGLIDNVRIYNYALSEKDIKQLYDNEK